MRVLSQKEYYCTYVYTCICTYMCTKSVHAHTYIPHVLKFLDLYVLHMFTSSRVAPKDRV